MQAAASTPFMLVGGSLAVNGGKAAYSAVMANPAKSYIIARTIFTLATGGKGPRKPAVGPMLDPVITTVTEIFK